MPDHGETPWGGLGARSEAQPPRLDDASPRLEVPRRHSRSSPPVRNRAEVSRQRFPLSRCASQAALALLLAVPTFVRATEPVVVERVLAVVDGTPVLQSEVQLVEALRGLEREAALQAVIDERLMLQEAARLAQAALTPQEAEAAYRSVLAGTPAAAALPEAGVRRLARRQAAIVKYVTFRFRPQVRVTDDDVRRAYEESPAGPAEGAAFEAAAGELRETLARRQLDDKIEAWVRELRAAADVRINPPPVP